MFVCFYGLTRLDFVHFYGLTKLKNARFYDDSEGHYARFYDFESVICRLQMRGLKAVVVRFEAMAEANQ